MGERIKEGFHSYRSHEVREDVVEIEKQKRRHTFGKGYHATGRWHPVTRELTKDDARAVRDLLNEWLGEEP